MTPADTGSRLSDLLLTRKEELASAVTDAVYAEDPALLERFGESGRAKCLQDMRYSLEHLAPALAMDDPSLFEGYVRWVENLLAARSISARDVRRSLHITAHVMRERLQPDDAAIVVRFVLAGVNALSEVPAL